MRTVIVVLVAGLYLSACSKPSTDTVTAPTPLPLTGAQLCTRDLTKFVQFKDPSSVLVNSVEPNDQRPGRYWMSVSAKNGFGGYNAPTMCSCGSDTTTGVVTDLHCDGAF